MKQLRKYNEKYFQGFNTNPVLIKPFDPKIKKIVNKYKKKLNVILKDLRLRAELIGSTKLEIAGKGEIEFAVFPPDGQWLQTIGVLKSNLGKSGSKSSEYVRFNDKIDSTEVEIMVMRGYTAKVNHELMKYLEKNPNAVQEYLKIKNKYKYSKQEYVRQKHYFFSKIVKDLPEAD